MDEPAELFRPQAPMDNPFLVPGRFKGGSRNATQPAADVRRPESRKSRLYFGVFVGARRAVIGIGIQDRFGSLVEEDQGRIVKCLIQEVVMDPLCEPPA